jgi:hypothetical protein
VAKTWRKWLADVSKCVVLLVGVGGSAPAARVRFRTGQAASGYDWARFGGA